MSDWLIFCLATLAVLRLAILVSMDDGPADAIKKARNAVPRWSSAWKGIRCLRCSSVWCAALVTLDLWWMGHVHTVMTPIYGLALSGGAILLNRFSEQK